MKPGILLMVFASVLLMTSCREEEPVLSDEACLTSFIITKEKNALLSRDYQGVIDQSTFTVSVDMDGDYPLDQLVPTIVTSAGATVSPASGVMLDFTNPVTFTVTSESGIQQVYTVLVSTPAGDAVISGLFINTTGCPYDQGSHAYFFTVNPGGSDNFVIQCAGQNIDKVMWNGVAYANGSTMPDGFLQPGSQVEFVPVNRNGKPGEKQLLVITTLPLVSIRAAGEIVNNPKTECYISVIDPLKRNNGDQLFFPDQRAGIELQGGLSQSLPKKSYSLELRQLTSDEEVVGNTRLLGLRDDGDWILDAMYVDNSRMRNRLSTDLWIAINKVPHIQLEPEAINGTRGYFVELFLNSRYLGIYCLSEKVDRKQLNLKKKEGFCYKATSWSSATEFISGDAPYVNTSDKWDGWELEYQSEEGAAASPPVKWEPLRNLIRFTAKATSSEFKAQMDKKIVIGNLVDYLLFINAIGADDNTGKNTYFSYYNDANNKFFITPWDLDMSWGRNEDGDAIDLREGEFIGITAIPDENARFCRPNAFFQRMMSENPSDFRAKLKSRWAELRAGELSMVNITNRVNTYKELFSTSGAFAREKSKWPETTYDLQTETQFMLTWIGNRLVQVDNYINGL